MKMEKKKSTVSTVTVKRINWPPGSHLKFGIEYELQVEGVDGRSNLTVYFTQAELDEIARQISKFRTE